MTIDESCEWDEEAIEQAYEQARTLDTCDPAAAKQLRAQAHYAQQRKRGQVSSDETMLLGKTYDPMRLYARMAKYYGFSHRTMDTMHIPTFFGYVREASIMIDEEQAEIDKKNKAGNTAKQPLSPQEAEAFVKREFGVAQPYPGEVVAYAG